MAAGPTISQQKILAASQGDRAALLEVLNQVSQVSSQQQNVTGTTSVKGGTIAGQPNASAPRPPQASGVVSILAGSYIVEITNPGAVSPTSATQASQQAATATQLTPLAPVTPIYHQIRASTSPAFNVNSNTQTFGGNTGSTQTYWTLTGLGTGTWYVQFRSSYDGVNFNTWKNANGGNAVGGVINQVTVENPGDSTWILFTMPGQSIVGIGTGYIADQGIFDLPQQCVSSGLFGIAGPDGFQPQPNASFGATLCDVDQQVPSPIPPATGPTDYPVEIRMQNGVHGGGTSPGSARVFGLCIQPNNENLTILKGPAESVWAVFKLPGGARIAFGQGKNSDGQTVWTPPSETWMSFGRMMTICSLTDAVDTGTLIEGYNVNQITAGVLAAKYQGSDGVTLLSTTANWMAIAWETGAGTVVAGGVTFLVIPLQGDHAVILGAGQTSSGTPIVLPAGYANLLSIATPASTTHSGNHFRGVQQCAMYGLYPFLTYTDNNNFWSGDVNWMVAAWK